MKKFLYILASQFLAVAMANAEVTISQQGGEQNCTAPCGATAVIFIHGLTGSDATWVNADTGASFPDLLHHDDDPQLKDNIDVYTLQYDSFWNSGNSIVDVTRAVSEKLDNLLTTKRYNRVAIVAHSLGGNIAREYLAHVKVRYGHAALSRFRMLITLGTPTEGASLARFVTLFSGNTQIRSLLEIRNNDFLQLLRETQIDYLYKRLQNQCAGIEFDAVFETKPIALWIIVPRDSATANSTRNAGENWNKNHLQLPKPADRSDQVYKWARDELALCAAGHLRCADSTNPKPICAVGDF